MSPHDADEQHEVSLVSADTRGTQDRSRLRRHTSPPSGAVRQPCTSMGSGLTPPSPAKDDRGPMPPASAVSSSAAGSSESRYRPFGTFVSKPMTATADSNGL